MNTLVFVSQNNIGVMKMSKEKLNNQNKENKQENFECQDEHQEHFEDQDEHQELIFENF